MANEHTTKALATKVVHAALTVLKENGGEMKGREVIRQVGERVDLDAWARERYDKTGYVRWESVLHFYTINCVKAGYLVKKRGIWYLTDEGDQALKLGPSGLLKSANAAYRKWREENPKPDVVEVGHSDSEPGADDSEAITLDQIEQIAQQGLEEFIGTRNPYEFQDLVAALMRGMGYFTPFVAPRGKDGGIDIVAYRDPLGTVSPRIKVQVKHRPNQPAPVQEIRQLMGILQKDGDVGIFVSTGGFTADAKVSARESLVHVELIDLNRFITLWQEFYPKLDDEDKALMPLRPVFFYAPAE